MRHLIGLGALLFALPALGQDEPAEKPAPKPEAKLVVPAAGGLSDAKREGPAVFVRIHSGGSLQYKDDEKWTSATLESLGEFLDRTQKAHHERAQADGKTGYEEVAAAHKWISSLFLSIRADPETPWQHVEWILSVAAEHKFHKLELSDGKRRLLAFLPVANRAKPAKDAPPEVHVGIHVVARAEKAEKWGGGMVMRPTAFLFRYGNLQSADLATVSTWIAEGQKNAKAKKGIATGDVGAGHKVPFVKVFDVMECFVQGGLTAVSVSTQVPDEKMRTVRQLPFPNTNYDEPGR